MKLHMSSVSIIAALAVSGGAALAQSGDTGSFCDVGYARADTNSDGMIDKDELAKVTEAEFSSLDANDDGSVTMAEYTDCRGSWTKLASNGNMLTDADLSALDLNKDGKIDQSEYMEKADQEYMARWSGTGTEKEVRDAEFAPATPKDQNDGDAAKGASTGASGSDSEVTNTSEAAAASGPAEDALQAEPKLMLRRIVFTADNADRSLTDMSRDEVAHRSAQMFLLLDTNRNKLLDPAEQKGDAAVQANMDDMLNTHFQRADTDGSGDLSREEYAADMEARWQQAKDRQQNAAADVGAPVVYYRYPHPM